MDKEKVRKNRYKNWFTIVFYLYPLIMIGFYYLGWITLFRICAIPIIIIFVVNIYGKYRYANWLLVILQLIFFLVFSEIGYIVTKKVLDGICMGCYVSIIIGAIESFIKKIREKNMSSFNTILALFVFAWSLAMPVNSQIVTKFSGEDALLDEDTEVYVEEVDLYSNYTYIKITIKPKHYMSRLNIWTSPYTYVQAGYKTLKYLGALSNDEKSYHSLEYDDGYGWDNVSSSYKFYFHVNYLHRYYI